MKKTSGDDDIYICMYKIFIFKSVVIIRFSNASGSKLSFRYKEKKITGKMKFELMEKVYVILFASC